MRFLRTAVRPVLVALRSLRAIVMHSASLHRSSLVLAIIRGVTLIDHSCSWLNSAWEVATCA